MLLKQEMRGINEKKVIIKLSSFIVVAIICAIVLNRKNTNPFSDVSANNIKQINISKPSDSITIEKEEDITSLLNSLKEMKLTKMSSTERDGFAFIINIEQKNGEIIKAIIRSKDIAVDNKYYKTNRDYCDKFSELFNQFSQQ